VRFEVPSDASNASIGIDNAGGLHPVWMTPA
jgi:hypothetical protein